MSEEHTPVEQLPSPEQIAARPPVTRNEQAAAADKAFVANCATLASIGEAQLAIAADTAAMMVEMGDFVRSNLTMTGDSVAAFLRVKTLVEAVEMQFGFARRSLDVVAAGSTKLGALGLRLADDVTKPMRRTRRHGLTR